MSDTCPLYGGIKNKRQELFCVKIKEQQGSIQFSVIVETH